MPIINRVWIFLLVAIGLNGLIPGALIAVSHNPPNGTVVALAATRPPVTADPSFAQGATAVVWKADGSVIAAQGAEGIVFRDAKTLKPSHFLTRGMLGTPPPSEAEPRLVGWCGKSLAFEIQHYNDEGNRTRGDVLWRDAATGRKVALWRGAQLTSDYKNLYFSTFKGRFHVLNLQSGHWFDVVLPLRETKADPHLSEPEFRKLDKEQPHAYLHDPHIFFAPDGLKAADQTGDGHMRLWDVKTRQITAVLIDQRGSYVGNPGVQGPVSWSPDGQHIVTLGEDPEHFDIVYDQGPNDGTVNEHPPVVKIWDARTSKLLSWRKLNDYSNKAAQLLEWLDNRHILVGGQTCFEIWNALGQRELPEHPDEHEAAGGTMTLSPDGTLLLAGSQMWRVGGPRQAQVIASTSIPPPEVKNIAWNQDGQFLTVAFNNQVQGGLHIWRMAKNGLPRLVRSVPFFTPDLIGWTRHGRLWASNLYSISFWDAHRAWHQDIWEPFWATNHNPPSAGLLVTSDENTFLQLEDAIENKVWRLRRGQTRPQLWLSQATPGSSVEFISPDNHFYGYPTGENEQFFVLLYDLIHPDKKLRLNFSPRLADAAHRGDSDYELTPIFSGDGHRVAYGGRIFALPSGRIIEEQRTFTSGNALALSSNGYYILRGAPGNLSVYRISGHKERLTCHLSRDASSVSNAAFSPDDHFIALARRGQIEIWDWQHGLRTATALAWPTPPNLPQPTLPQAQTNVSWPDEQWLVWTPQGQVFGTPGVRPMAVFLPSVP